MLLDILIILIWLGFTTFGVFTGLIAVKSAIECYQAGDASDFWIYVGLALLMALALIALYATTGQLLLSGV